jgi:nitroreductase
MTQTQPLMARLERTAVWRLKLRLQFTGWLQYLPPAMVGVVLAAVGGLGALLGAPAGVAVAITALGGLGVLVTGFDLLTAKHDLRPREAIPAPRDHLDPFELMRSRRSCRSYQSRNLTDEHRAALLASAAECSRPAAQLGESPIRFEYVAAPLTVWPVVGAHEFLVAIAPREYDRTAVIDVGRSLQKVVVDATRMGLGTCWIGPGADQRSVTANLGDRFDPERDHVICVCAVGYASRFVPATVRVLSAKMHSRIPVTRLFFADSRFSRPLGTTTSPFDEFGRCYEVCQWSPSSYNGQTTRCVGVTDLAGRPTRFDFYAVTTSRYYAAVATGIWVANWETGCEALGIAGHVEVLSAAERGLADQPALPRYDVSWVVDTAAR